jgi:quinol monooxygenase YgiN
MSQLTVIARIQAQEGKRDELVDAFAEYFPQVEHEDGTRVYAVSTDTADETAVWVYEMYTGGDALQAHSGSDAFKAFGAKIGALLAGAPELHICTPVQAKGLLA